MTSTAKEPAKMNSPISSQADRSILSSLLCRTELLLALVIIAVCILTGLVNDRFLSLDTLFGILRNSILMGILAVGVLVVMISGGIDVSFTGIAVFALYGTTMLLQHLGLTDSVLLAFAVAGIMGAGLGLINAVLIGSFGLPTFIVTLGTLSLFRGALLTLLGSSMISSLPHSMGLIGKTMLIRGTTAEGSFYSLPAAFLVVIAVAVVTWLLLEYTVLGRNIFAIGGSRESARRIGINILLTQYFIFTYVGFIAGIGGLVHGSLTRTADPLDLVGRELSVIAAVVLGGARLTGGHGSVLGTLLGVGLIVLVTSSLIMLGVPATWQNVVVGALILIGTAVPTLQRKLRERRR